MSIHPTLKNSEVEYVCDSIKAVAENHQVWSKDYTYISELNDFVHNSKPNTERKLVEKWFKT